MIYMGNYLKQISASRGLISASRFPEMYDAIQDVVDNPKWDSYGTAKSVRSAYDFRSVCTSMGIKLIPNDGEMFTVDVDGAYDSALFVPLIEAVAPYVNDGEVVVRIGSRPFVTKVTFTGGKVDIFEEEADFKTIAVQKTSEPQMEVSIKDGLIAEWEVRYQKAVDAIGGEEVVDNLPRYFKDCLRQAKDIKRQTEVLEAIAELRAMVKE